MSRHLFTLPRNVPYRPQGKTTVRMRSPIRPPNAPRISIKPSKTRLQSQVKMPAMMSQPPVMTATTKSYASPRISQTVVTTHFSTVTTTQTRKQNHLLQQAHHHLHFFFTHCWTCWDTLSSTHSPI